MRKTLTYSHSEMNILKQHISQFSDNNEKILIHNIRYATKEFSIFPFKVYFAFISYSEKTS